MRCSSIAGATTAVLLLTGCAPTAEQIATMTAAAWTPTPVATPTATPIPYQLTVHVADETGAPLGGARIVLLESGSDQPVQTDSSGTYTWPSVNGPQGTLQISAPGYYAAAQPAGLQRGPNELAVFLQPDPNGLRQAEACAPGEKLVYLEDFQSGEARNWRGTAGRPDAWAVAASDDGNRFLSITGSDITQVQYSNLRIEDAVLRLRVRTTARDGDSFVNLKHSLATGDKRYIFQWGATPFLFLTRFDSGSDTPMSGSQFRARPGEWHYLELSNFQGRLEAWANGQRQIEAQDSVPLPAGTISLEAHIQADPNQAYQFDNISVCELDAPFTTSMFKAPAQ